MSIKFDEKDRKIIEMLELNARYSDSQIAKKIGLSKDAVSYRIKKMEKTGLITGYYSVLNIAKLGLIQFKILISFQNTDSKKEREIIDYLKNIKEAGWVVSCSGYYNLMAVLWMKSPIVFDEVFNKFLNKYSQYCEKREIIIIPEEYACRKAYLLDKKYNNFLPLYYGGEPSFELDEKDMIITRSLANNSRESLHKLAYRLKLTSQATAYRIKKLAEKGILLAFRPKLNTSLLGYSFYNIFFKLKKLKNIGKIYEYLKKDLRVVYISKYLGTYDLGVDIEIKKQEDLTNFLTALKDGFLEDIQTYIQVLVYQEHKLSYFPD